MPHLKPTDFDVTKHSDFIVWKDTSERVARRCDDTVDKKRVNSCQLKHLFWRALRNQKYRRKIPEMFSPTRYQLHVFKISRLAALKKTPRSWLQCVIVCCSAACNIFGFSLLAGASKENRFAVEESLCLWNASRQLLGHPLSPRRAAQRAGGGAAGRWGWE